MQAPAVTAQRRIARPSGRYWITRVWNVLRRLSAGLGLRGECVWDGVHNDLFVAHASIYHFFSRYVSGKQVIDAGCGSGYGSMILAEAGAASVVGIDIDPRAIRYARRHYRHPALEYRVGDCQRLDLPVSICDLIVSSNLMEHLHEPERFLRSAYKALIDEGVLLLAIPPITNEYLMRENQAIRFHVSNFYVDQWLELFSEIGWTVSIFRQAFKGGSLDFSSPFQTARSEENLAR